MTTIAERARAAIPYGLPTVDLHRILVNFALDPGSPEFKAPLNAINHTRGLADPSDVSVVAMNVDTPYSWAWLDLRSGPVVLAMPPHPADRYMSAQIVDLYTSTCTPIRSADTCWARGRSRRWRATPTGR